MRDLAGAQRTMVLPLHPIVRGLVAFKEAILSITLCKERRLSLRQVIPFHGQHYHLPREPPHTNQDFIPIKSQNMAARHGTSGHAPYHMTVHL